MSVKKEDKGERKKNYDKERIEIEIGRVKIL